MWTWLRSIIYAISDAILNFFWKRVKEPKIIEDEKTPNSIKHNWNQYVDDQLCDKNSGH
jgi:hypothetical protein